VDLDVGSASLTDKRRRRVKPGDKPLDVKALADELSQAILSQDDDKPLQWTVQGTVRVKIAEIVPDTNKQTTSGRRKRLWKELEQDLKPHGWIRQSGTPGFRLVE